MELAGGWPIDSFQGSGSKLEQFVPATGMLVRCDGRTGKNDSPAPPKQDPAEQTTGMNEFADPTSRIRRAPVVSAANPQQIHRFRVLVH